MKTVMCNDIYEFGTNNNYKVQYRKKKLHFARLNFIKVK